MEFNFEDVHIEASNKLYPSVAQKINKAFPKQSEQEFVQIIGPMMGIFIGFSQEVTERVLETYKDFLLNKYPELKKYKL